MNPIRRACSQTRIFIKTMGKFVCSYDEFVASLFLFNNDFVRFKLHEFFLCKIRVPILSIQLFLIDRQMMVRELKRTSMNYHFFSVSFTLFLEEGWRFHWRRNLEIYDKNRETLEECPRLSKFKGGEIGFNLDGASLKVISSKQNSNEREFVRVI